MTPAHKKGDKITLKAEKRDVFGKKLDALRREDKVPANVFGKGFPSTAITIGKKDFTHTFHAAGETQVVYVQLDKDEIPVLVADYHVHPVTDDVLHVDFRKVDLKQKTEAEVPVILVGEAEAVEKKKGDLHHLLDTLTVEALPADMPSEIEVDVTGLAEVDDTILVSDIKISGNFTIQDDPETMVAKIAEHKEEDLEPATADEAAEGEAPAESGDASGENEPASDGGEEKSEE